MDLSTVIHAAQASAYGLLVAFVALAVWAFYTGKVHSDREFTKLEKEKDEYKAAYEAERARADEVTRAGTVTNQLIGALTQVAQERAGLTAKDPAT